MITRMSLTISVSASVLERSVDLLTTFPLSFLSALTKEVSITLIQKTIFLRIKFIQTSRLNLPIDKRSNESRPIGLKANQFQGSLYSVEVPTKVPSLLHDWQVGRSPGHVSHMLWRLRKQRPQQGLRALSRPYVQSSKPVFCTQ